MSIKRVPPRINRPPAMQTGREGSFTRNGTTNKNGTTSKNGTINKAILSGRPNAATPKK